MGARKVRLEKTVEEYRVELIEILGELKNEPTIVEGKKDAAALERLGFTKVFALNVGRSLYDVAESVCLINGSHKVLILTDFDPEGEEIAKRVSNSLLDCGCRADEPARARVRVLFLKNKINTVEGLQNLELAEEM